MVPHLSINRTGLKVFDETVGGTKCSPKVDIEREVEGIIHFWLNRMLLVVWIYVPLHLLCI